MIPDQDLPALYRAANTASTEAQIAFLRLTQWTLFLLCIGAVLAASAALCDQWKTITASLSAAILVVSIILNSILNSRNPEKIWYGSRAVAESVKTLVWRYMTRAEPFPQAKTIRDVEQEFAQRLRKILQERQQLAFALASPTLAEPQITDKMRQLRSSSFEDRKAAYIQDRVFDQQDWYSRKATENRDNAQRYFWLTTAGQLLAVVFAVLAASRPEMKINAAGLFTTLASSLIAWMQLKQYSTLAQSYAVTAIELGLIHDEATHVTSDAELAAFVADAENAISREHTLWVARRDRS